MLKVDTIIDIPPLHDVATKWGREPANEMVETILKNDPPVALSECNGEADEVASDMALEVSEVRVYNPEIHNIVTICPLTTSMGKQPTPLELREEITSMTRSKGEDRLS